MTSKEALRALGEMININDQQDEDKEHFFEAAEKIMDKEVPFKDSEDKD